MVLALAGLVRSSDPPVVYAGPVARALSQVLDFMVLVGLNLAVVFVILLVVYPSDPNGASLLAALTAVFISVPSAWLYFAWSESGRHQATPGARACHLRVIRSDGARLSFWRATVRYAARLMSFSAFGVGHLLVLCTPRRQAVHDLLVDSVVVRDVPRQDVVRISDRLSAASSGCDGCSRRAGRH